MIYISENDPNIADAFTKLGMDVSGDLAKKLAKISSRTNNNYIGYYQFKNDSQYYKILVVPKIFEALEDLEKETCTYQLLTRYYRLKNKYPENKNDINIEGNVMDLSFDIPLGELGGQYQDLIQEKYKAALNILHIFFKQHNRTLKRSISYKSKTINSKIDLKRNILNIDKSYIYQKKSVEYKYSEIAEISREVLRFFTHSRVPNIASQLFQEELSLKVIKLNNLILKKYHSHRNSRFKVNDILSMNISKLFRKNSGLKKVYEALIVLSGLEQFMNSNNSIENIKLDDMVSLFFRPEKLYEWIVYDHLIELFPGGTIAKDGLGAGTSRNYALMEGENTITTYKSKSDFIVNYKDEITVYDAKWKIIKDSSYPDPMDALKLKRDVDVIGLKNVNHAVLVYPQVSNAKLINSVLHLDIAPKFNFRVIEVNPLDC